MEVYLTGSKTKNKNSDLKLDSVFWPVYFPLSELDDVLVLDVYVKSFLRRNKVCWLEEEHLCGGTWEKSLFTWIAF